jgi:hypothetical protein
MRTKTVEATLPAKMLRGFEIGGQRTCSDYASAACSPIVGYPYDVEAHGETVDGRPPADSRGYSREFASSL